jgi:CRP-like cAMP-binding protein
MHPKRYSGVPAGIRKHGPERGPTEIVARRLGLHSAVDPQAEAALETLLGTPMSFEAGALIAKAGDGADPMTVMREGFACRMSLLPDGRRQIHSVFLPGDTVDAETPLLAVRPDNIEALTPCSAWLVPKSRQAPLLRSHPALAEAFAREGAIAAQVAREWVVNVGRRTALERIAHLICELHARLDAVGLVTHDSFVQPMTQPEIADAQGLSTVHVNRVMQQLRGQGLIRTDRQRLFILDIRRLQDLALFDPLYLQLLSTAAA